MKTIIIDSKSDLFLIAEEDRIISENELINDVKIFLESNGHKIESFCLTTQKGADLVTNFGGKRNIFEFKGTKTELRGGNIFNPTQNKIHFGEAIVQILTRYTFYGDEKYHIVFPFHNIFKRIINQMGPQAFKLPFNIWFVGDETLYLINNN